ncbi:amino acid ABC transporter permease [Kribbella lupini]|uniref:Amino acid ABC transporter permease n=1 Tax=Kribbella lupini TaxID=291602 RepID=A0ABN2CMR6_9ACTN
MTNVSSALRDSDGTASVDTMATMKIAPVRRPVQWIATGVVLILLVLLLVSVGRNPNMGWDVVGHYLLDDAVLRGVRWTLVLTVLIMALATALGIVVAVMATSGNRVLSATAALFLWFFRGTPLLVQIIFWFNLALIFPRLGPAMFLGEGFGGVETNSVINWFVAALLAFGLHQGAIMSEIVRGGFLGIERGQTEAAQSLGMTAAQTLRRVLLPQTLRIIVPPSMNQFVDVLKGTALVAFIAGQDLLSSVQFIYAKNFQVIPLLIVASIWYLALVSVATVVQYFVERRLGLGYGK